MSADKNFYSIGLVLLHRCNISSSEICILIMLTYTSHKSMWQSRSVSTSEEPFKAKFYTARAHFSGLLKECENYVVYRLPDHPYVIPTHF